MDLEYADALLEEAEQSDRLAASDLTRELAVLGPFDPRRLEDVDDGADVLRLLCRELPGTDAGRLALLAERYRVDALAGMLERGRQSELARVRRLTAPDCDTPLQRMLDAFVLGTPVPLEQRDEDELLASLEVWRWVTDAVARAGRTNEIPVEPSRDDIESRLALLHVTRAVRTLSQAGCIGRDAELERLHAYRHAPPAARGLTEEPAMVVYGIGGVGKSTLVARFVMDLYEASQREESGAWAYLDLDRPTLSTCEPDIVLADVVRQVAAQFPDYRKVFERSEEVLGEREKGAGLESADFVGSYRQQASEFAWDMQSVTDGSLVVVLDTFEQLERRNRSRADELYELFAALASDLPGFRLIVSGRSPAERFRDESRPDRLLHVRPLADDAAVAVLRFHVDREAARAERRGPVVDDDLGREIVGLVGGIPLTLRLAARVLVQEGTEAIADAAERAYALDRVRSEFVRGFLYHRILDHITASKPNHTDDLRRVARASIVLRRVTVELVEQVLLPAIDPRPVAEPSLLFEWLASEVAFAEEDGAELRLREELRVPALVALKFDAPELVQHVHELAASFYDQAPEEDEATVEAAYHRLAAGQSVTDIDEATLRELRFSLGELPQPAVTLIEQVLSDPQAVVPEVRELGHWERQVLPEADAALRNGDLPRARELLTGRAQRTPGTELHRLESRLAEADGHVDAAVDAARRDLDACAAAEDATRFASAAVRLAGLQERQAAPEDAEATLRDTANAPLLTGYSELRLELLLNRMNTLERARLDTDGSRWLLGLDARALIQRTDPRRITTNTALLRLIAAALGRDEPERILDAVSSVGLGHEEDPVRVHSLVSSLTDWDVAQPEPGSIASRFNLRVDAPTREAIERAWASGVAGLGTEVGITLARVWRAQLPPEPVREAVRMIYVWWGTPAEREPERGGKEAPLPRPPHFLTEVPLRWSRKETLDLEDIVRTAYPTSTESQALADRAGLDLGLISWETSGRRTTRELLGTASRSGKIDALVAAILDDPSAVYVHQRLRALVGQDWLKSQDLL